MRDTRESQKAPIIKVNKSGLKWHSNDGKTQKILTSFISAMQAFHCIRIEQNLKKYQKVIKPDTKTNSANTKKQK